MPAMPRLNKRTTTIAYAILGVPPALRDIKKTREEREREKRLLFEATNRMR